MPGKNLQLHRLFFLTLLYRTLPVLLLWCTSHFAFAQFPTFPLFPNGPAETEPFSAPVRLEDRILFRIYDASRGAARDRADLINFRLNDLLRDLPNRPLPVVRVQQENGNPVLMVNGEPLLTVTKADAEGHGKEPLEIAREWEQRLETAFTRAIQERRPEYLRQAAIRAGTLVLIGFLAHLALWFIFQRLLSRPGGPLIALLWLGILLYILDLFPQTRPAYNLLTAGALLPVLIAAVVMLGALVAARIWTLLLHLFFPPLSDALTTEERTERTLLRRITLIAVVRVTGNTILWFVAIVVGLTWAGVNLPALLASAGLIGVALGLAAQDTMKDLVAGINILLDDRFGVGDVIRVGEYTGKVERFNLRVTQIRDLSGRLVTFPNRVIETVANLTASWSQVDLKVRIPYRTDLRRAMEIVEETANGLAEEWPERILEPPEMLGVNAVTESNLELRMIVRTTPGDQWKVERELHLRVKEALEGADVPPPFPHQVISVIPDGEEDGNTR
ncbi:MAG: mechanosensitive ion channel family protein [Armatimonadetes bacterium]|nr:mechanosensitive ion channel family protein [Armatimonadota bacterium]